MSSIVNGFEYDIFISYRHNDNRSGWVTDFVNALQEELASTIKEPLSIYFDKNPHDGLLETHNVDKSLEGKLKSLIFIPIISQTYCDTKSFAWQHEFVAFNKQAKEDQFGRDIKLSSGNVASRILPVKIHDLDTEDKSVIESEMGGVLRAIEFIFKSSGVNRPLTSSDKREENSNKTLYRDQVNKVANALKEIITAIKNPVAATQRATLSEQPIKKPQSKKPILILVAVLLIMLVGYFIYQQRAPTIEQPTHLDRSIAVLPFVNMSNDPEQEYFSDGLSEELLNLLAKIPELKVIARTSSFAFKGKNEDIHEIGRKLGVGQILEGSVRKSGNTLRITAQLIKVEDGTHLWSETYDREMDDIFKIQDEIASKVVSQLKISLQSPMIEKANSHFNKESYKLMLQADFIENTGNAADDAKAIELYEEALKIDSMNSEIWSHLAFTHWKQKSEKARDIAAKAIALDPMNGYAYFVMGLIKRNFDWEWKEAKAYFDKALSLDEKQAKSPKAWVEEYLGNHEEAIRLAKENIQDDPLGRNGLGILSTLLSNEGRFDEAMVYANKNLKHSQSESQSGGWYGRVWNPHYLVMRIYLQQGKSEDALTEANKIIDHELRTFCLALIYPTTQNKKEADLALEDFLGKYKDTNPFNIAEIYANRGEIDKAFAWLEKAFVKRDTEMRWLNTSPWLKKIHNDNRYDAMLAKVKLPKL